MHQQRPENNAGELFLMRPVSVEAPERTVESASSAHLHRLIGSIAYRAQQRLVES